MKWDDHRSWVLGSLAGLAIAFGAAAFSVVYAGYYNRTHHIAEWGALGATLRTPVPLWFVFLLLVATGVLGVKAFRKFRQNRELVRRNGILKTIQADKEMWETVTNVLKMEKARLERRVQELEDHAPKVHVSWPVNEGKWSLLNVFGAIHMSFTGRATFSSSNTAETIILTKAYMPGTAPGSNIMLVRIPPDEPLLGEFFHALLKPVLGIPEKDFILKLIFVDTKGREYQAPDHTFQYSPPPAPPHPQAVTTEEIARLINANQAARQ